MTERRLNLDRIGFLLTAACLGLVQFSIASAQILFGLSAIVWSVAVWTDRRRPDVPAFFTPLVVYAALTLVSSAFSIDPRESFWDSRQLVLFAVVPVVARFARAERASSTMNAIIALGAAGAVVGVIEYALLGFDTLASRPTGTLSHYMTYSGVLMLVTCAAVSSLLFYPERRIWPAIAVPALLVALASTQARNAWIGAVAAITALLGARRFRYLIAVPVLIALFLALAPTGIRHRAFSIFDSNDPTSRDRRAMWQSGLHMIRDHPWFGVGPEMVIRVYPQYKEPYGVNAVNVHLHNVPIQIAAERGIPALLAWLWFVVVALRDLVRQLRHGPARAVAGAGAAAVVAMLAAGLFEYNFGDSEFLILFLGLITLPYAATRTVPASEVVQEVRQRPVETGPEPNSHVRPAPGRA